MNVGTSAVVTRRGGVSSTYDEINKFFAISYEKKCLFI